MVFLRYAKGHSLDEIAIFEAGFFDCVIERPPWMVVFRVHSMFYKDL